MVGKYGFDELHGVELLTKRNGGYNMSCFNANVIKRSMGVGRRCRKTIQAFYKAEAGQYIIGAEQMPINRARLVHPQQPFQPGQLGFDGYTCCTIAIAGLQRQILTVE